MNPLHYIILSFIQAATEFLPISSSGHLLFYKGLSHTSEIPIIFDVVVHVGSLIAIVFFYHKKLVATFKGAWLELIEKQAEKNHSKLLCYIVLSTIVTLLFYVVFKESIEARYQSPSVLFFTFLITTMILFSTFFVRKKGEGAIPTRGVLLPLVVGLFQGLAIMPGISRSGSTISPLLLMGIKREEAAYYSFFLAIPAIFGALVFKLFEMESMKFLMIHWWIITFSFLVSALFSYFFLALLTFILRKGRFWAFSVYTLLMAFVSLFIFS